MSTYPYTRTGTRTLCGPGIYCEDGTKTSSGTGKCPAGYDYTATGVKSLAECSGTPKKKSSGSTCSYNSQCSSGYCKVRHCSKTCVLQCARSDAQAVYSEAALLGRASLVTVVRV